MKTIQEVCKLTGASRRALQGYNEIGLLKPTAKNEAGHWLYDDSAIRKITLIQILNESGYTRNKIKEIFNSPQKTLDDAFISAEKKLEEKRREIDCMITFLRAITIFDTYPESVQEILVKTPPLEPNYDKCKTDIMDIFSSYPDLNADEIEIMMQLGIRFSVIGMMKDKGYDDPEVMDCAENFFDFLNDILLDDEKYKGNTVAELIKEEFNPLFIHPFFIGEEMKEFIDNQYGEGTHRFILAAYVHYVKTQLRDNEKRKEVMQLTFKRSK